MSENSTENNTNLRSWKNLLIDPVFQFSFAGYVLVAISLYSAIVVGVVYAYTDDVALIIHDITDTPDPAIGYLLNELERLSYQLMGLTLCFIGLVLAIMLVETHRIAGASYAIKKFLTENIMTKKYTERLTLRKKDYFVDLADCLNAYCDTHTKTPEGSDASVKTQAKK